MGSNHARISHDASGCALERFSGYSRKRHRYSINVRGAVLFSIPGRLEETIAALTTAGEVPAWLNKHAPLDFLIHREGGAKSVIDAAYRYARHEHGSDIILLGTGVSDHVRSNIASILSPPLPTQDLKKLENLFGRLEGVGLDLPESRTEQT